MANSVGQQILAVLELDFLTAAGQPLITFLGAVGAAAGDPLKISAALVALQGSLIGQLPTFEASLSQQIATALQAKLAAAIAAAQAKAA